MKKILYSALALFTMCMSASAQLTISFDSEDYKNIGVYDQWEESPFRTGALKGNAAVADNPSKVVDEVLGIAPNTSDKVVAVQRSRHAGNAFGVRIDLKEPIRLTKELQYIHVMTYVKDKPADSRMMVMGLGKRVEESWSWQSGEDEQFWAWTTAPIKAKDGWQDIVVSCKGFSYSKEQNPDVGIDIYALVIVPDLRSPHADAADWVAYFDEIVIDNNPEKRFTTDKYALEFNPEAAPVRSDRGITKVGLNADGANKTASVSNKLVYNDKTSVTVFPAAPGTQATPTFTYTGTWMSGYAYVDWNNDGKFTYTVNADGTPAEGSDIVSYNGAEVEGTWRKSDGSTTSNGNTIQSGMPAFTVPASTPVGFYRMRYKVDWNSLNPAGAADIIANGGGVVDVILDVHGETVSVSASQLNGDIVLAADNSPLQDYKAPYAKSLKVKLIPEKGFVQNGFQLKYGYNVNAAEQFDENGNPNWILANIPAKNIAADSTYTIPAAYMRGGQVSIVGDMQQVRQFTVKVVGAPEGKGGVIYTGVEYANGAGIDASQHFNVEDVEGIQVEGYMVQSITFDGSVVTIVYIPFKAYRQITNLSELRNDMAYHITAKSGEGYWAWNTALTDQYISLRGVTNTSFNGAPKDETASAIYTQEVSPFDSTVIWQILKENESYYVYQPALQQFVTRSGRDYVFTPEKTAVDNIRDNGDGTFSIHAGGGYSEGSTNFACIVTNESTYAVRNWTWSDHGSVLYIIENPNIEVEDIISTGIESLPTSIENLSRKGIYNLHGQKLVALPKQGVVIVDGKKKIIK